MPKLLLKIKARRLRRQGFGYKTIAHKLLISSSTAKRWCEDIRLSEIQIEELKRRSHDPYYGKRKEHIQKQKKIKADTIEKLRCIGIKEIGKLSDRDIFIIGVALYWAEGFKKDRRLGFANSDPTMINLFIKWLTSGCKVPKKDLRLRIGINISHSHRIEEIQNYWSITTNVPLSQFQKPFFQKFKWKKEFPNPDNYFGVLRIRANKQLKLFRKIHGWIEGLKQNR